MANTELLILQLFPFKNKCMLLENFILKSTFSNPATATASSPAAKIRHISTVTKNCMLSVCTCPIPLYKKLVPSFPTLVSSFHPYSEAASVYSSPLNLSCGLLHSVAL